MSDKILICRCEDVTKHEVRAAIDRGHRDLESVKRYTGLGTGWCQGKQCLALCGRMLEALGGIPPDGPMTPRPPFHPVPLWQLAELIGDDEEEPA